MAQPAGRSEWLIVSLPESVRRSDREPETSKEPDSAAEKVLVCDCVADNAIDVVNVALSVRVCGSVTEPVTDTDCEAESVCVCDCDIEAVIVNVLESVSVSGVEIVALELGVAEGLSVSVSGSDSEAVMR